MDKKIEKILQIIFDSATYDEEKKEYQISKKLYKDLNLSKENIDKINKRCLSLGITIQYPHKLLKNIQEVELFERYNEIKYKIDNQLNSLELEKLEQERIEIRNRIAIANLDFIKEIINRRINGKNNSFITDNNTSLEDIYQIGYEVLLHYIDTHYLYPKQMKNDLNHRLLISIERTLGKETSASLDDLIRLKKIRTILNESKDKVITIKSLSKQLELEEDYIISLLNLNNIQNPISLEQEKFNQELIDDTLEEELLKKYQQENLNKILDTLQIETQKQIIILTNGLNGEEILSDDEISKKINLAKKSIHGTRNYAISKLKHLSRSKYLAEILDYEKVLEPTFDIHEEIFTQKNKDLRRLEKFLLLKLEKEILIDLVKTLSIEQKTSLFLYLNYNDLVASKYLEKSKEKYYFYQESKEKALFFIRNKIEEIYVDNNKNEDIQNYLDYLMYNYLNKPKKLCRTK